MPFETEIFKGVTLLLVRTAPMDTHYRNFFEGTKREFEVQVQGKFKRAPEGEIYVGAEATQKMELGIITRSACRILLNFVATMVNDSHYSFGDLSTDKLCESPHLVAPLLRGMDKVVVSKPGEKIPEMGGPFHESPEARKKRTKSNMAFKVDVSCTYSFSVNTSNLDLCAWNIVGVPMVKNLDMRSLFGDAGIRLVAYELPRAKVAQNNSPKHAQKDLKYVFNLTLNSIDPADYEEFDDSQIGMSADNDDIGRDSLSKFAIDDIGDDEEDEEDQVVDSDGEDMDENENEQMSNDVNASGSKAPMNIKSPKLMRMARNSVGTVMNSLGIRKKGDLSDGFDVSRSFSERAVEDKGTMSGWIRSKFTDMTSGESTGDVQETDEECRADYALEGDGDLDYCSACIEASDHRKEGRRRLLFVLPYSPAGSGDDNYSAKEPRLRSYHEFTKSLTLLPLPRQPKNKKLSVSEKRRRQLVESLKNSTCSPSDIKKFLFAATDSDRHFLGVHQFGKYTKRGDDSWEGGVAVATARRHWTEEYLVVNRLQISWSKTKDARRCTNSINVSAVLSARALQAEEIPIPGYHFFEIETVTRVFYFLTLSDSQLREWINAMSLILTSKGLGNGNMYDKIVPPSQANNQSHQAIELDEAYLARPVEWKNDKRRIYNYRRIIFRVPKENKVLPSLLVEKTLSLAFEVTNRASQDKWIEFLDSVSLLQIVNVTGMEEKERTAVLLNLYHIMVLHGNIVRGPPVAWGAWPSFFNSVSYVFNYETMSIADLEYNILRGAMSRPSPMISKITVPNTVFPGLALTKKDFRINFAINCGSKSLPEEVPIFKPVTLDEQLDAVTFQNVQELLEIDASKRVVYLPKVCSWYLSDFVSMKAIMQPAPIDCLRALSHYSKGTVKTHLTKMLTDTGNAPAIKFKNFSYRCRTIVEMKCENTYF